MGDNNQSNVDIDDEIESESDDLDTYEGIVYTLLF